MFVAEHIVFLSDDINDHKKSNLWDITKSSSKIWVRRWEQLPFPWYSYREIDIRSSKPSWKYTVHGLDMLCLAFPGSDSALMQWWNQ